MRASVASSTVSAFTLGTGTVSVPELNRLSPSKNISEAASTVAKPAKNQRERLLTTFGGATATDPERPSMIGIAEVGASFAITVVAWFCRDMIGIPAIERSTSLRISAAV